MVMERVAAGPVDQPDVGIGEPLPVVLERLPGTEQHVGDPRDRDEATSRIRALRQTDGKRAAVAADLPIAP